MVLLVSRVSRLNEDWTEWTGDEVSAEDFRTAISLTMDEFDICLQGIRNSWLRTFEIVEKAFQTRFQTHPSGKIIELSVGCPFEVTTPSPNPPPFVLSLPNLCVV